MRNRVQIGTPALRLSAIVLLALTTVQGALSGPPLPQADNLLDNGGFEVFVDGLADGWTAWSKDEGLYSAPGYAQDSTAHSGLYAQKTYWQSTAAGKPMYGGLYQQVTGLTVGQAASFSVWHDWPGDPHDGSQSVALRIAIDPQGGIDPDDAEWSEITYASSQWQKMSIFTTVLSTTVTVFIGAQAQYPSSAYVLWDDAVLTSAPWQHVYLPAVSRNYVPPCALRNGGFEGVYTLYDPANYSNKLVAPYWIPTWQHVEGTLADPEYNFAISPDPVHGGEKSQQYGTFRRYYKAGLYQQLDGCTVGGTLRFSAWGWAYATDQQATTSDPSGDMRMRVGIDPSGGADLNAASVRWSSPTANPLDTWMQMSITATVTAPTVTLFVLSEPAQAWLHNTCYWDDAHLEKLP
ncbi:MAG: hypothetical protein ACOYZ7_01280 [Chloroflexota bacterium]